MSMKRRKAGRLVPGSNSPSWRPALSITNIPWSESKLKNSSIPPLHSSACTDFPVLRPFSRQNARECHLREYARAKTAGQGIQPLFHKEQSSQNGKICARGSSRPTRAPGTTYAPASAAHTRSSRSWRCRAQPYSHSLAARPNESCAWSGCPNARRCWKE